MVEEDGRSEGREKKDEPAKPQRVLMEFVESQPDEKEVREIDAVRVAGNVFEDFAEERSGDFAELGKQQTKSEAAPPRAGDGVVAQVEQSDESQRDGPKRRGQIEARKSGSFVGEDAGHEARGKNEPVREAELLHVVRVQTCNDGDDPKKSEGQRRAPLSRDEIDERKKQIHTHFVRQTPERSNCRFRVGEILKQKNIREDTGSVQVGKKELTVAKMADRKAEQFDEQNNQDAQGIDTKDATDDEGSEQRSARGARFLALKRKEENQAGVNKKDEDAAMADGHEIEMAMQRGGVLEIKEQVKKNNKEDGAGAEEVEIGAFRCGVQA